MDNTEMFGALLEFKKAVFAVCLGHARNYQDAEELTQEVYLKALGNLDSLRNPDQKKQWLLAIARNTARDHLRKQSRWQSFLRETRHSRLEDQTPETLTEKQQALGLLKKAIGRLPEKTRIVFILKEYGQMECQEIARDLDISPGTVMSRLDRARKGIIKSMRNHFNEKISG